MMKLGRLNLSFGILTVTIIIVSVLGLQTIKDLDYILNDSVSIYRHPTMYLNKIEEELLDIRYRMASVSANVLSFASVHYRLEHSLKKINELLANCQKWRLQQKSSTTYEEQLGLELMNLLPSAFSKQKEFFNHLDAAYRSRDIKKVRSLYENQWPYVHSSFMVPIQQTRKSLNKFLNGALDESLRLKFKFQTIWFLAAIIVFIIASLIYLSVRRIFLHNEELHKEHMAMSKIVMLGEMASSIVHEINNPLSVIQMNGQILKKDVQKNGDLYSRGIRTIPDSLLAGVERINKIITGLKSFVYQGADEGMIEEFEDISIGQVIEDSLLLTNHKMKKKGILFTFNKAEKMCVTRGSVVQLSQVFVNLINNASDAVENLSNKWITVDIVEHRKEYEVRVTDSGTGIDPEIQEKIFKTFYTTKTRGKGTGLGLSISRKILMGHNGRLTLDQSSPNTCFQVFLPRLEQLTTI